MQNLTVFENPAFGTVRTVEVEGEPWLVGRDVAAALGYSDTDQALRRHVDDEDKLTRNFDGSGQNRSMTIINESGLYSLVLSDASCPLAHQPERTSGTLRTFLSMGISGKTPSKRANYPNYPLSPKYRKYPNYPQQNPRPAVRPGSACAKEALL